MKLFGGKHRHTGEPRRAVPSGGGRKQTSGLWRKLNGTQRGLILLALSVLILAGTVLAVSRALVKPPELPPEPEKTTAPVVEPEQDKPAVQSAARPAVEPGVSHVQTSVRPEDETDETEFERPGSPQEGFYNILLVGVDGDGTRTDTILIARLDANRHTVAMMSVPRDTLVNGSYTVPKINAVYGANGKGEAGVAALREKLASMLGFEVNGYVLVDLKAFVELVDLVGGVTFDVPQRMYYSDPTQNLYIDLNEGEQLLDGNHAMQLVRYRKYAEADIKRTQVQQDFLKALAKKCLSFGSVTKLKPMIELGFEYVETDLSLGNILYFTRELLKCDIDEMETCTLPGEGVWINGGSYYALYANQTREIVNENFNPYDSDIPLSSFHIRYANSAPSPAKPVSAPAPVLETPSKAPDEQQDAPPPEEAGETALAESGETSAPEEPEAPRAEESAAEEPVTEEPAAGEEPSEVEPTEEELTKDEPASEAPALEEPAAEEAVSMLPPPESVSESESGTPPPDLTAETEPSGEEPLSVDFLEEPQDG